MSLRPPSRQEGDLIAEFSLKLGKVERHQLLADLENASVSASTPDASLIAFEISGYERPKYHGQHLFVVEGKISDSDGADVSVLLHADENG